MAEFEVEPGVLYLVGTPIGNLRDISFRAIDTLKGCDVIAAEDTRSAQTLRRHFAIDTPTISFFAGNEERRIPDLIRRLKGGETVAVISEAGMPAISDPGQRLVAACIAEAITVDVIPGPSAATTAVVLSGFPSAQFTFVGFPPRKGGRRTALVQQICETAHPVVLFESPKRLVDTLKALQKAFATDQAKRPIAVTREVTKLYQEVQRGDATELIAHFEAKPPRGEITIVVGPGPSTGPALPLETRVAALIGEGKSPKQIAEQLQSEGYRKRAAYQAALALQAEDSSG